MGVPDLYKKYKYWKISYAIIGVVPKADSPLGTKSLRFHSESPWQSNVICLSWWINPVSAKCSSLEPRGSDSKRWNTESRCWVAAWSPEQLSKSRTMSEIFSSKDERGSGRGLHSEETDKHMHSRVCQNCVFDSNVWINWESGTGLDSDHMTARASSRSQPLRSGVCKYKSK